MTHVGQPGYFTHVWPKLDVAKGFGKRLYWAWCHPILTLLILVEYIALLILTLR